MKQMKSTVLATALCLFSLFAFAQSATTTVPGVSDKGYWVIEGNVKTPLTNTILFYTNNDELVYRETVQGIKLNINRKKTRIKLQQVLESALVAWQQNKQPAIDKDYVKVILK